MNGVYAKYHQLPHGCSTKFMVVVFYLRPWTHHYDDRYIVNSVALAVAAVTVLHQLLSLAYHSYTSHVCKHQRGRV